MEEGMRATFLGTGGGRFVTMRQSRATGGWILDMEGQKISIDPGPGALVRAKEYGADLKGLSVVVVSHAHPDHYTDAEMMIETMTNGCTSKKGVLLGNEHAINGGDGYSPRVSPYHIKFLDAVHVMAPGKEVGIGHLKVLATKSVHTEPKAIGFVFSGSRSIGYVSDTEFFDGIENQYKGCEFLVLNCMRPRDVDWPKHMNTECARKIISGVNPESAIITHFGARMLQAGPEKEAEWLAEQTGVDVIASRDGMVHKFN